MVLRLDPRFPIVWRTPDSIQIGVDRPLAVVSGLGPGLERVVAALRGGVPEAGAVMIGVEAGASAADVRALLLALRPALATGSEVPSPTPIRHPAAEAEVCVDGMGPTADRIRLLLGDLGIPVRSDTAPGVALAVLVAHYVLEPERHGRWLRRDLPHLPVIFSDTEVRIGPLVEPGDGPCLSCLEQRRVDEDAAWPAMAVQLLSRTAPTETVRASIEVATSVAMLVQDRLCDGRSDLAARSLAREAATGEIRRREHPPHERCGCRSLPENVTALGESAAARRMRPSSA